MSLSFETNAFGEQYLYEVNRNAFFDCRAGDVFQRDLAADLNLENTLYLVIGSDSSLLARHLCEGRLPGGARYVFIEPADIHAALQDAWQHMRVDLDEHSPGSRMLLRSEVDWFDVLDEQLVVPYLYAGSIQVVNSLGSQRDYTGRYTELRNQVIQVITELTYRNKSSTDTQMFLACQITNAADNVTPAASLGRIGEGRTAIVLGAGPSLDERLDWIRAHREQLFVIAVSRVADRLQDVGLEPDVVVAIDPQRILYDISRPALRWQRAMLVCGYHVVPELLQQWRGPTAYLGNVLPWQSSLAGHDDLFASNIALSGPTVGHSGVVLAAEWGFSTILMAGIDLCFARGGRSHTQGSAEAALASLPTQYDVTVSTYSGREAGTTSQMQAGVSVLSRIGDELVHRGIRLINMNPEAARIESIPCLEEGAIALDGKRPVLPDTRSTTRTRAHLQCVREELSRARIQLNAIMDICSRASECIQALHHAGGDEYLTLKRRLDGLEDKLESRHGAVLFTVKYYAVSDLLSITPPDGLESLTADEFTEWGVRYYRTLRNATRQIKQFVVRAQERQSLRAAEFGDSPDYDALLSAWQADGVAGRVLQVLDDDARSACLTPAQRSRYEVAASDFLGHLEEVEHDSNQRIRKARLDMGFILRTCHFMFQKKSMVELESIAQSLMALAYPYSAAGHFASALAFELGDAGDMALEHYQEALEQIGEALERADESEKGAHLQLMEDTLLRINHLYLAAGDGESALGCLALLSTLSTHYVSHYARLMMLLGNLADAADILQLHLQHDRYDWRTMHLLADCYARLGLRVEEASTRNQAESVRSGLVEPALARAA